MPRNPANSDRHSLAAMMAQNDKLPSVGATKTLIRAAFIVTNGANRPYIKLGMNLSEVDVLVGARTFRSGSQLLGDRGRDPDYEGRHNRRFSTGSKPADSCSDYLRAKTAEASEFN